MHRLLFLTISIFLFGCSSQIQQVEIQNPASDKGKYPRLFTDNTGTIFMNWYESSNDTTQLYYSMFEDNVWSKPQLIAESDSWFVNWADFPSIIGVDGEPLAAHWLKKKPGGTYSYDVNIANAADAFSSPFVPHKDGTPTEHGFVSMVPLSDSTFYAVWLDGRNTMGSHGHNHEEEHVSSISNAMTLRGALINDNGEAFDQEIDPNLCECCNISLVTTQNGLLVAYRDRTDNEVRDIYVSSYSLDTEVWSSPVLVHEDNWEISACPVNGPMMDAYNNNIAIAWFTGANDQPVVKAAFSSDGGTSFSETYIIDDTVPLGRVDIQFLDEDVAWLSWMSRNNDSAELKLAEVSRLNGIQKVYSISEIDPSRSVGFPQLTKNSEGLMLAWTDINDDSPKLRTVIIQ